MQESRRRIAAFTLGAAVAGTVGVFPPTARGQKVTDIRLNTGVPPGVAHSSVPRIATAGSRVYAVWQDDRSALGVNDIYLNRSADSGATWLSSDIRINTDPAGSANARNPQIVAIGSTVYVVWQDNRNGQDDIYLNRSLDGGITWMPSDQRVERDVPGSARSESPQIAASGTNVYVVWQDKRNGQDDIYLNRSLDSGATWLSTDARLDTGDAPGNAGSQLPAIALAGGDVCVTWSDRRNVNAKDIYFNRSSDSGLTWLPLDMRLDTGSGPGSSDSTRPQIATSGSFVYVVWGDRRLQGGGESISMLPRTVG